jgi:flagellar protein FliO/FliZ
MGGADWRALLGAVAALAGVVALVLLLQRGARAWRLPARRGGVPGRRLALEETLALDPRRRLHLIRCGERRLLLLTGGGADVAVGWLPDAAPPP